MYINITFLTCLRIAVESHVTRVGKRIKRTAGRRWHASIRVFFVA